MSEPKNAFVVALAKAQSEMENAVFNKTNPHFRSSYADLGAVRAATITALGSNGFIIVQTKEIRDDGSLVLKTELTHESGESRFSYWPIKGTTDQQQGSSTTYGRRYDWASICGIASEEDDDANESERANKPAPAAKTKAKSRADGDYEVLTDLMRECSSKSELKAFVQNYTDKIDALPESWKKHLRDEYARLMEGLDE